MKILLTGVASFTGFWIARSLVAQGHRIVAPLDRGRADYDGLERQRLERLSPRLQTVDHCRFGSPGFLGLLADGEFDLLCHHAAHDAPDGDVKASFRADTLNLGEVLERGQRKPGFAVILTGTVAEQNEGRGTHPRVALSPAAQARGMTADAFRFWCRNLGVKLAKFVVPEPFGPYEDANLCHRLISAWAGGESATIAAAAETRDYIHVSLLAAAYADLVARLEKLPAWSRLGPSLYAETEGAFAQRFAREIGRRLQLECPLTLATETAAAAPRMRINTDSLDHAWLGWNEQKAWDELADHYRGRTLQQRAAS